METGLIRKGIINSVSGTANVKTDAASGPFRGQTIICADSSATPPVEIMKPIPKGACIAGVKQSSQAEVTQKALIGRTTETIVASTRYRIEIWNGVKYEGMNQEPFKYAYTSAAVLSGTAATDRVNVYTALQNKINAHSANGVIAYIVYSVAYTLGKTAVPVVGETVTQTTSSVTATIAGVVQTSGTITGTDAAGTIYLCNFSAVGSWLSASKTLTGGTSTAVMTTAAVLTTGEGLYIADDAGYYGPRPNGKRKKSLIMLTQGFTSATVEISASTIAVGVTTGVAAGLPGLYAVGIGTRMLQDVPVFTPDGVHIVSGEAWMQGNASPVAGTTYRTFLMEILENPSDTNIDGAGRRATYWMVLWVEEDSGDTNVDAFEGALETSLGITFA